MQEHVLETVRTARYFTLGEAGPDVRDVWFVLHGYGQQAQYFLRAFRDVAGPRRLLVAPEALSRFYLSLEDPQRRVGACWMTRADRLHEIADYVRYLDGLYARLFSTLDRARTRVTVLGFSQGAATAARWVAQGRVTANRLILWGGELPPDLGSPDGREGAEEPAARLRDVDLTLVVGTEDAYMTPARTDAVLHRLQEQALPYRLLSYPGGHSIQADVVRRLVPEDPA